MGRPLNKKYFGNRNIGTGGYQNGAGDDFIGGEGVGSVTINTAGSYTSALPTATFSAPNIPGGVNATGTVHGKAISAVATVAGTGYNLADVLTPTTGATGTYATFNVTGLKVVGITLKNGGTANDVGDIFEFQHAGFATPLQVRVTASSGGTATAVEIADAGVWTTGALPAATDAGGFTRVQTYGSQDMNGQNLEVNITAWGVATVGVATLGDYTAITSGAKATSVSPAGGTGATLTVTYGVKSIVVDEKGSGYTTVGDAGITFSGGAAAAASVLTTDSGGKYGVGGLNAGDNQENSLLFYAKTTSGGTAQIGDVIKQEGAKRYKVKTADGTAVCKLVGTNSLAANECYLIATDSGGATYYVTKLSAKKAVLLSTGSGSPEFEDGVTVRWTIDAPTLNTTVQLANA